MSGAKGLFAGLFVCVVAGNAGAETLVFTDRALFTEAVGGGLSTIDFESAPTDGYTYVGNTYTVDGVTFSSNHMYLTDGGYLSGYFSLGTGDALLAGYVTDGSLASLTAELKPGTRAVGLDLGLEGGGTYTITFASGETTAGTLAPMAYDGTRYVREADFVGFISDADIASIRFDSPESGGWKLLDNFTHGGGAVVGITSVSAVPLPAGVWGGIALLGGLGVVRRFRRASDTADELA